MRVVNKRYSGMCSAGVDNLSVDWVAADKVSLFKMLFDKIREKLGGYEIARRYVGFSSGTMDRFEKNELSTVQGAKILAAYKKCFPKK